MPVSSGTTGVRSSSGSSGGTSSGANSSDAMSSGGGSSWRGRDLAGAASPASPVPPAATGAGPPGPPPRPGLAPGSAPVTPLTITFRPNPVLSTRLRSASHPLVVKPFRSPSRGKPRVSSPSSRDRTLALLSRIQATRRSRLTASRTAPQFCRSESAEAGPAGAGGAAGGALAGDADPANALAWLAVAGLALAGFALAGFALAG